jgi:F-type H+-transporting ATPase subunit delta
MSAELARLLQLLADRDRLHLVGEIADLYDERVMKLHRVVRAEVVTAAPLDAGMRASLSRALGQATHAEVRLTERVDPDIIGGVTATVGTVVFDGSVATHLERLRQRLHQRS